MRILKRKNTSSDKVECLLKPTLDMICNLDRREFNRWLEGAKSLYEGVQHFCKVKTINEKENGDIDEMERKLEKELQK